MQLHALKHAEGELKNGKLYVEERMASIGLLLTTLPVILLLQPAIFLKNVTAMKLRVLLSTLQGHGHR